MGEESASLSISHMPDYSMSVRHSDIEEGIDKAENEEKFDIVDNDNEIEDNEDNDDNDGNEDDLATFQSDINTTTLAAML